MSSAVRFRVTGRVQGVAFRAHAREQALSHHLRGHAFNQADGSVEILVAGEPDDIEAYARWLMTGPPLARVDAVEREPAPLAAESAIDTFVIG